jgi:hypothetical protein
MKWLKAAAVGALGSLLMFVLMAAGIYGTGIAPFNVPPSAAFLTKLGLNVGPLPLLVHFGYGATWAVVLAAVYGPEASWKEGLAVAGGLWLFMMLVYSPFIGWGVFGFGGAGHSLPPDAPLYLGNPVKYVASTLLLHGVYGLVIGTLVPRFLSESKQEPSLA